MKESAAVEAIKSVPVFYEYFFKELRFNEKDIYEYVAILHKAYPALDIATQIFRMGLWLADGSRAGRHKKNYRSFIMRWLSRSADRQPAAAAATIDRKAEWRKDIARDNAKRSARAEGPQLSFDDSGITDEDIKASAAKFRTMLGQATKKADMKAKIGHTERGY